jgi:hypothetical protein
MEIGKFLPACRQAGEIIWNLACLRGAASAKAGAWDLVLITVTFKEGEQFICEVSRGR